MKNFKIFLVAFSFLLISSVSALAQTGHAAVVLMPDKGQVEVQLVNFFPKEYSAYRVSADGLSSGSASVFNGATLTLRPEAKRFLVIETEMAVRSTAVSKGRALPVSEVRQDFVSFATSKGGFILVNSSTEMIEVAIRISVGDRELSPITAKLGGLERVDWTIDTLFPDFKGEGKLTVYSQQKFAAFPYELRKGKKIFSQTFSFIE